MIDEKKLIDHLQRAVSTSDNSNFTNGLLSAIDIVRMQSEIEIQCGEQRKDEYFEEQGGKIKKWIPVSKKLPDNERDVEITCTEKYLGTGETIYFTARAFYTDGTITTEDSNYNWDDCLKLEYSEEKDAYLIPEGWWESVYFGEEFTPIDAEVIAWRPLAEPYKP